MRLIAVSIVKNEADIIEAFVRHTAYWVDHHLVFDHESTDGTREILQALQREGLPLALYTDGALANLQQDRSNHLSRLAVTQFDADWVLPLDADELFTGPSREDLEEKLASAINPNPFSLYLCNYYPTKLDDGTETNPVLRLRYCQQTLSPTKKIIIPRSLILAEGVIAGKGSHALYRDQQPLADLALPVEEYHLAHLALRSPQHQVLRVVLAELQKLSRGSAAEGLDTHYRLGYQLLAENPKMFFDTLCPPITQLRVLPITYQGDDLKYSSQGAGWNRLAQALLPFLERLAISHGKLLDGANPTTGTDSLIREIIPSAIPSISHSIKDERFIGFDPIEGWGESEGPVPEAFLPTFHWGHFPTSQLRINADSDRTVSLNAEMLTYVENQSITIRLNEQHIGSLTFTRTNQKENLSIPLRLKKGDNLVSFNYSQYLATDYDARQLSTLFLSLRINGLD